MKDGIPVVSIIGKPNIGKSTLVNRVCMSREAIVHEAPMITRDRKYYKAEWRGKTFYIMDTGGMDFKPCLLYTSILKECLNILVRK